MSKLNLHRNLFLEREELLRFQKFMLESPVNKVFLQNTTNWGIIDTGGGGTSNDFKIEAGTNSGTVKIANTSRAITESGLLIEKLAEDNISIPDDSTYYWLKIGHEYSNLEEGTLSISSQGVVTGIGTKFTEVLRGQSTEDPVKIKLVSTNNIAIYEIVDVVDDLNCLLQGESFVAENGIKYYVIGSTPLGETVTTEQQEGLYYYDSCVITQVEETVEDTEPAGLVENEEFWIARVINNSGTVTVEDKRTGYFWEYYIRGVSDKLDKNQNLNDVANKSTARSNLGVLSEEDTLNLLNVDDSGWFTMDRGVHISSTNYEVKIRRLGSIVCITGKFQFTAQPEEAETLFSIAYSVIGDKAIPSVIIRSQVTFINGDDNNDGCGIYIDTDGSGDLQVRATDRIFIGSEVLNDPCKFHLTYIGG